MPPREAPPTEPLPVIPVLRKVEPTGPAPTNFAIRGTPLIAQLSWDAAPGAASYQLWRAAGSAYAQQIAANLVATQFSDQVPDPAPVYQYRLVVNYANGTWGEAVVNWTSPPLTQPSGLQASLVGKRAVQLMWNPVAGAIRYRLDGAGIAATGLHLEQTSALVYAPVGAQSWQVMTLYPGNVGDFQNRPGVSLMIRALPPHTPAWLTKSNGAGSDAEASYHYRTMFGSGWKDPFWPNTATLDRNDVNSNTFRTALHGAGYDMNELDQWSGPGGIRYLNTTELGASRATACEQIPGPRTICWTNSHGPFLNGLSLIMTDSRGCSSARSATWPTGPRSGREPGRSSCWRARRRPSTARDPSTSRTSASPVTAAATILRRAS
ncbi:MAG: hypothetical protein HC872_02945 [Gammaproteobacteria bacterium]|nr:hypothetical protein [Gammaproteobacteria bacterium]